MGVFHFLSPRVIVNEGSTARDYLARERNFLSFLKLAVTLFTIAIALLVRFQVQEINGKEPEFPDLLKILAIPFGSLYFATAIIILVSSLVSFYSYQTLMKRHTGFVQSGWGTSLLMAWVTFVVGAGCIVVLVAEG
ncbi:hypothetical protein BT69DRAFT_1334049 [Atractiella rhizophila]|nr:hypothetical protein BT69DRAFT_1334049 [Atractiella rhizophila]